MCTAGLTFLSAEDLGSRSVALITDKPSSSRFLKLPWQSLPLMLLTHSHLALLPALFDACLQLLVLSLHPAGTPATTAWLRGSHPQNGEAALQHAAACDWAGVPVAGCAGVCVPGLR